MSQDAEKEVFRATSSASSDSLANRGPLGRRSSRQPGPRRAPVLRVLGWDSDELNPAPVPVPWGPEYRCTAPPHLIFFARGEGSTLPPLQDRLHARKIARGDPDR